MTKNKSIKRKKRAVVICPGRGTYSKETMGLLQNLSGSNKKFVSEVDGWRKEDGLSAVTELDGADRFKPGVHTKGENAAALIYACAGCDFGEISLDEFEIVSMVGNSMGWYLALALSGVLSSVNSYRLIQSMGSMMKDGVVGGQVIYPLVDDDWLLVPEKKDIINKVMADIKRETKGAVYLSIDLGGYYVLAGDKIGVGELLKRLPKEGDFPFQLINHGAFHTPLMHDIAKRGQRILNIENFAAPRIPLVDGRGHIFMPYSTRAEDLFSYTLKNQVVETYSFRKSVVTALKEFAPDNLILLGPGGTLGGTIGQILIDERWLNFRDKKSFVERQKDDPFLLSMSVSEQRAQVV